MNCRIALLCFYSTLFCACVNAQVPTYNFTQFSTAQGLSGNEAVKSVTDKNGFLWVATHNGINRFDGKTFKKYTYIPNDSTSLRSIWITDLLIDENKTLWASTEWGLCYYDDVYDRFRYINNKKDLIILYKAPLTLGKNNCIWMACETGLYKIDCNTKKITATSIARITDPQSIIEDNIGVVWIGTRGSGLIQYNAATNTNTLFINKIIVAQAHYMQLLCSNDTIWAATSEGLLQITKSIKVVLYASGKANLSNTVCNQLTCISPVLQNKILCGTYNKRLLLFDKSANKFIYEWKTEGNLPTAVFMSIQVTDNRIWLCTQNGLVKMQNGYANFNLINVTPNQSPQLFLQVLPDNFRKSKYWLLADNNGASLVLYNDSLKKIEKQSIGKTKLNFSNNKSAILQNKKGVVFTFVNRYINIFNLAGVWQSEIELKEKIFSACFDNQENIWIGTENGIAFIEKDKLNVKYYPFAFSGTDIENNSFKENFPVSGICYSNTGKLWMANIKYGLFEYTIKNNELIPHRQASSLSYETLNRCASVLLINDTVWVSNMSGITAYVPSTNSFINYNSSHDLASSYVYSIAKESNTSIWGRGNAGVFGFSIATKKFVNYLLPSSFDALYYQQSVNSNENNCFLGLDNSFATFQKKATTQFKTIVFINSCLVNGKNIYQTTETAILKHNENTVQFDFTSLNFENEPESFYYMLEGLNNNWIEASQKNNILFSNLNPGNYTFNLKSKRLNDDTFGNTIEYRFIIKAAFWQQLWFKIFSVLFTIFFALSWFYIRFNNLKKSNQQKEKLQKLSLNQYQKQLELEKIVNFFSVSLVNKTNVDDVLWDVCRNLISKLGFEDCMIYLWNENKSILIQKAGYGQKGAMHDAYNKENYNIKKGTGIIGAAAEMNAPLIINDTSIDSRYITVDGITRLAEICVPLIQNDIQIGMINAESAQKNFFTPWHTQLLSTIATLVADKINAIEAANSLQQKQIELATASTRLASTELALLRSQMNPHFIFNSLNSVQKYIWENNEEGAAEYLASFARLMRAILENSRHELVTLKQEIDILNLYVELEHRRSNHNFDYSIKTDQKLDLEKTLIPPMLLQPFIENSIWHGLNKKPDKGNLLVHIYKEGHQLICIVDDDGVGRQQTENTSIDKKSLGISITKQRIESLMESTSKNAKVNIEDKIINNTPAGTKVTVILPLQINNTNA